MQLFYMFWKLDLIMNKKFKMFSSKQTCIWMITHYAKGLKPFKWRKKSEVQSTKHNTILSKQPKVIWH